MNATDFIVGAEMAYEINNQKVKIKSPQNKQAQCKVVRVEAEPTEPDRKLRLPGITLQKRTMKSIRISLRKETQERDPLQGRREEKHVKKCQECARSVRKINTPSPL